MKMTDDEGIGTAKASTRASADRPARRGPLDMDHWARLSPLLDELLELEGAPQQERIEGLCETHPELAASLRALLTRVAPNRRDRFLEGTALSGQAAETLPGRIIGAYTLERLLGSGGMGGVWLGRRNDGRFEGVAAVKLPHPGLLAGGGHSRFAREVSLLGRLSHPHIATLLDAGVTDDEQPYLVIECVDGDPIDRWCDARTLGVEGRIRLFLDVLAAVDHAHQRLVLHRDLKPSNILVTKDGRVKLLDFGISKLLEAGPDGDAATQPIFTLDYAAPEQLQGGELTTATDVYALGVLLYELLCGCHPTSTPTQSRLERMRSLVETDAPHLSFSAGRAPSMFARQRDSTPTKAVRRLRGDLDNILTKALKKSAAERYPTAAALADDLRRHLAGDPVRAAPDTIAYRTAKFVSRHRLSVGAATITLLVLVAGIATTTWQAVEARQQRDEARYQAERSTARNNLVNLMLGAMGDENQPMTQREVLARAEKLVESTFGHQPGIAVELLLPIAGQYGTLGDSDQEQRVMRRAAAFAAASGDENATALVRCSTVDTAIYAGHLNDAAVELAAGMHALQQSAHPRLAVRTGCLTAEASLARERGDTALALDRIARGIALAESEGEAHGIGYTSMLSLQAVLQQAAGDLPAALATEERLVSLEGSAGRTLAQVVALNSVSCVLMDVGEYASARDPIAKALAASPARSASAPAPSYLLLTDGMVRLRLSDVAGAQRSLAEAHEAAKTEGPTYQSLTEFFQAQADLALGRLDSAERRLQSSRAATSHLSLHFVGNGTPEAIRAQLLLLRGRIDEARRVIDQELTTLSASTPRDAMARAGTLRIAARIALAASDPQRASQDALSAVTAAERFARSQTSSADVGEALLLLAQAQVALNQRAAAGLSARRAAVDLAAGLSATHPLTLQALAIVDSAR